MLSVPIFLGVDRHAADVEFRDGSLDADGDLGAIGRHYFLEWDGWGARGKLGGGRGGVGGYVERCRGEGGLLPLGGQPCSLLDYMVGGERRCEGGGAA